MMKLSEHQKDIVKKHYASHGAKGLARSGMIKCADVEALAALIKNMANYHCLKYQRPLSQTKVARKHRTRIERAKSECMTADKSPKLPGRMFQVAPSIFHIGIAMGSA